MKKWIALILAAMLLVSAAAFAEEAAPTEEAAAEAVEAPVEPELLKRGSSGELVRTLQEKLNELGFDCGSADGIFGGKTEAALIVLQEELGWEATGEVLDSQLAEITALMIGDGVNLALNTSDEWSVPYQPEVGKENRTFFPTYAILGEKAVGDVFTCQVEIEFANVTAADGHESEFEFRTIGAVDGAWEGKNIWNSELADLDYEHLPENNVYKFVHTQTITQKNVDSQQFDLGFRCDYWGSGAFRVRNVKVERGSFATAWSPYGESSTESGEAEEAEAEEAEEAPAEDAED